MAAKRIAHHFVPHRHLSKKFEGKTYQHRAHLLSVSALFTYLLVFSLVSVGLLAITVSAPKILGVASFSTNEIISLTNAKRAQNGLPPLSSNGKLAAAASAKAASMEAEDYWAHNSPSGKTPWFFISGAGYRYVYAGENLARDFADAGSVVDAWMKSPSHKDNILDKNFKEIGVAVTSGKLGGKDGILVVQMFGSAVSQAPTQLVQAPSQSPTQVTSSPQVGAVSPQPGSPQPTSSLSASGEPSPNSQSIAQTADQSDLGRANNVVLPNNSSATVLASRKFSISKIVSLGMTGFIFALFVLEVLVVLRKEHLKLRPSTLAHLGILGFVLLVVWWAIGGSVI